MRTAPVLAGAVRRVAKAAETSCWMWGGMIVGHLAMAESVIAMQASQLVTPVVQVSAAVPVSGANALRPHWEVQLASDPTDSRRLIACSIVDGSEDLAAPQAYRSPLLSNIVVYRSQDGGRSWQPSYEHKQYPFNADPTCAFGPDGTAYFMSFGYPNLDDQLAAHDEAPAGSEVLALRRPDSLRMHMPMFRSRDGGTTWERVGEAEGQDRPFITIDDTKGPYRGRIYIDAIANSGRSLGVLGFDGEPIYGAAILRSIDQGRTYQAAKLVAVGSQYIIASSGGVVLSDGTFGALYGETPDVGTAGQMRELHPAAPNAQLKFVTSHVGGEAFGKATVVAEWYLRFNGTLAGLPSLAVDRTQGPFQDRLYAAWIDARSGRGEIRFSRSEDKGKTWLPSVVISDNWPRDLTGEAPDAFMPTLAVNRSGVVGVTWYDRRDHVDNRGYDIRFSASLDGGESFLPSVLVAPGGESPLRMKEAWLDPPYHMSARMDGRLVGGFEWDNLDDGGDTAGLTCDTDGVFHPLWIDRRSGVQQVATARITVNSVAARNGGGGLEALSDLSAQAQLRYSRVHVDPKANVLTIGAAIYNRSARPIRGKIRLRVLRLVGNSGALEARNADNGVSGPGAVWEFNAASGATLEPGTITAPRLLVFKLGHALFPPQSLAPHGGDEAIEVEAKILGE